MLVWSPRINDELLAKFELFLIGKGLSNGYVFKSMKAKGRR